LLGKKGYVVVVVAWESDTYLVAGSYTFPFPHRLSEEERAFYL